MKDLQIVVNQQQGTITTNFNEVKEALTEQMEVYKELEVTEDNKPERKKDIATLRKMIKAVSDKRIGVKKECLKPYEIFEKQATELVAIINAPINTLDSQVKEFEEKQRLQKVEDINNAYGDLVGDMAEYLPLTQIYNSKWENISFAIKAVREEIEEAVSSTEMAVNTIKGMSSEAVPKALEQYKKDLSLANAIAYINRYEQQRAEILAKEEQKRKEEEERKRRAEEARIREEERKRVAEEERIREEARRQALEDEIQRAEKEKVVSHVVATPKFEEIPFAEGLDEPFDTDEPFEAEEQPFSMAKLYTYEITATDEDLEKVDLFLDGLGVLYLRREF